MTFNPWIKITEYLLRIDLVRTLIAIGIGGGSWILGAWYGVAFAPGWLWALISSSFCWAFMKIIQDETSKPKEKIEIVDNLKWKVNIFKKTHFYTIDEYPICYVHDNPTIFSSDIYRYCPKDNKHLKIYSQNDFYKIKENAKSEIEKRLGNKFKEK